MDVVEPASGCISGAAHMLSAILMSCRVSRLALRTQTNLEDEVVDLELLELPGRKRRQLKLPR